MVALDATAAAGVVRLNDDLVDGTSRALFDRLADARVVAPGSDLPTDARRFTGTLRTPAADAGAAQPVSAVAIFTTADGQVYRVPLATTGNDGAHTSFAVDLPETGGHALRLSGFDVDAGVANARTNTLEATGLLVTRADGISQPVDLGGDGWSIVDGKASPAPARSVTGGAIAADYAVPTLVPGARRLPRARFAVVRDYRAAPVPAVVTPEVLGALSIRVGQTSPLSLPGGSFPIVVVGVVDALPTTEGSSAALLLDLPSATIRLLHDSGIVRSVPEWWISGQPTQHAGSPPPLTDCPAARWSTARRSPRRPLATPTGWAPAAGCSPPPWAPSCWPWSGSASTCGRRRGGGWVSSRCCTRSGRRRGCSPGP